MIENKELGHSQMEITTSKKINLVENIRNRLTWLIWIDNFEYQNLINFKRKILDINNLTKIDEFDNILTDNQRKILENYKNELYDSSIYGSPLEESEEEKRILSIWEDIYYIEKNIKEILKNWNTYKKMNFKS